MILSLLAAAAKMMRMGMEKRSTTIVCARQILWSFIGPQEDASFLNSKIHHLKMGITSAGCCSELGHVILGGNTQATVGACVADTRQCKRLHKITSNIYTRQEQVHQPTWTP